MENESLVTVLYKEIMKKLKNRVMTTLSLKPRTCKEQGIRQSTWESNNGGLGAITEIKNIEKTCDHTHVSIADQMELMTEGSRVKALMYKYLCEFVGTPEFNWKLWQEGVGYCLNGTFGKWGRVHNGNFKKSSGIVGVVVENIHKVDEAIALFTSKPNIAFCYSVYLQGVLTLGVRVDATLIKNDDDFRQAFHQIEDMFRNWGYEINSKCKDVSYIFWMPGDPDRYYNPDAAILKIERRPRETLKNSSANVREWRNLGSGCRVSSLGEIIV